MHNGPIPQEWHQYVTQTGLNLEVIPDMLYSTKAYVSGATTVLTFFDTVKGARPDLTNMAQPNLLPQPETFLIKNIRIFSWGDVQSDESGEGDASELASQFDDMVQLTKRGLLNIKIGNKQYGPWPLWTLPAHNFVKGAFSTGSDVLADYGQVDGMLYELDPYLMIGPLQQFEVSLTWPGTSGDPIPGGPVTLSVETLPLEILFDGARARSIQ